jgi:hypothetical protein
MAVFQGQSRATEHRTAELAVQLARAYEQIADLVSPDRTVLHEDLEAIR